MSTAEIEPAGIDPQVLADLDAVMKRISDGAAVDAETSRRIEERADRFTAEIAAPAASWTTTGSRRCFMTMIYLRQIHELVAQAVFIDETAGALTKAHGHVVAGSPGRWRGCLGIRYLAARAVWVAPRQIPSRRE